MGGSTSQAYDLRVSREPLDPERIAKFATALAFGIVEGMADSSGSRIRSDDLTALLCISAWMRRAGAELGDCLHGMLRLRTALVRAAGMDERSEPVPLLHSDQRVALLNLARYLEDLVRRAALVGEMPERDVASRAIELLVA
jgi:hypothetical protein